jgi:hypothetical protein
MRGSIATWVCVPAAAGVLAAAVVIAGCQSAPPPPAPAAPAPDRSPEHGKYLVETHACNDCHTPFKMGPQGPEPDMTRMLSGHPEGMKLPPVPALPAPWGMVAAMTNTAWAGPWGISYTANLTPDKNTGHPASDAVGVVRKNDG